MPLDSGLRLGAYEILAPLGAGGMGEVYRARDVRLGREVALKILPTSASQVPGRQQRLMQEARAVAALSHPNIVSVLDVGFHQDAPFVVSELLEGETLRERLAGGPLPSRKAVECAVQIARGLAAAHDKGVVHRDLKPENVFVTREGRVKLLDFGLAKLDPLEGLDERRTAPLGAGWPDPGTDPGTILGTVGYMAPEQVRGERVDHRADVFAVGAILYEMLSGRRAFQRETAVETLSAILREEPPPLEPGSVSPPVERIMHLCLEKRPEERFQAAGDLALALEAVATATSAVAARPDLAPRSWRREAARIVAGLALVGALGAVGYLAGRYGAAAPTPRFHALTFRRGTVHWARLAPDERTVIYSASWEGRGVGLFSTRSDSPESTPIEPRSAHVLAISSSGEMALMLLGTRDLARGTLARRPIAGGAPRELVENVEWADWAPDGERLAIVRWDGNRRRLEFPVGAVLHHAEGWLSHPRVSPGGDAVAFLDHPVFGDNRGSVEVVDLTGKRRTLSGPWKAVWGLAWRGSEVWFCASESGSARALFGVDLSGETRLLARLPLRLTLHDISPDGERVLLAHDSLRRAIMARPPGEAEERELTWLDYSNAKDLSTDGRTLLFSEDGEAGRGTYAVYVRNTDGSPAVRLGEGKATSLSPDGKWALSILVHRRPQELVLLPTGAGEMRTLPAGPIESYVWANWFPDNRRILVAGSQPGRSRRLYVQDVEAGSPRAVGPETVNAALGGVAVSPDGEWVAVASPEQRVLVFPVRGGEARAVPGLEAGEIPIQWTPDGKAIHVFDPDALPAPVYRVDTATGEKQVVCELMPSDPAGITGIGRVRITPDESAYVYTFSRILSELYLVQGLR